MLISWLLAAAKHVTLTIIMKQFSMPALICDARDSSRAKSLV